MRGSSPGRGWKPAGCPPRDHLVLGSGFGVWGLECGVLGLGLGVWGFGMRVSGSGFGGFAFKVLGIECRIEGSGFTF